VKKVLGLLFLLGFCSILKADMPQSLPIEEFSGGVDVVSPDKINQKFGIFSLMMNVRTDDGGQLRLRNGSAKDNPTALTGSLKIRNGYNYKQVDGDEYKIWASSTSVFAATGASYSTVITTLSASYTPDFATANGNLWLSDGYNWPGAWDGSTLTIYDTSNSTGMVKGRYIEWAWQRMWFSGVTGHRNRVYYSEALDPANINALENFIDIAPDDGDYITGLLLSGGSVYVTRTHSTWEIYIMNNGDFNYRQVNPTIGCLYNTCLINFRGYPAVWSHRGIETLTDRFNTISAPIDNFFKSLNKVDLGTGVLEDTTAADFGAGTTFANVSTTTYSGSVAISSRTIYLEQSTAADWGAGSGTNIDTTTYSGSVAMSKQESTDMQQKGLGGFANNVSQKWVRQSIVPETNQDISIIATRFTIEYGNPTVDIKFCDNGMNVLFSTTVAATEYASNSDIYITTYPYISLTAGTTYYLTMVSTASFSPNSFGSWWGHTGYSNGKEQYSSDGITWEDDGTGLDLYFICYTSASLNASYETGLLDFGYSPSTWGNLTANYTTPINTSISFQAKSSTDNVTWTSYSDASTGSVVPSTIGRYLKVKTSFAKTDSNAQTPILTDLSVSAEDVGSFTSQAKNAGTGWGSWGAFTANETVPSGSDIDYYIQCSTYSTGRASASFVSLTNGAQITSVTGPYCWVTSSFTRTDVSAIPKVNSYAIEYYGSNDNYPQMIDFEDSLYVSASTATDSRNCLVMVYQKDDTWTQYDWDVGAWCINKGNLYFGSSRDDGQIYKGETEDIFTDAGTEYEGSYAKGYLRVHPYLRTLFTDLWVVGEPLDSVLSIDYRTDGSSGDWTTLTTTMTATNAQFYEKTPLKESNSARTVQLRIRSSDNFRLNRLYLNYFPILKNE